MNPVSPQAPAKQNAATRNVANSWVIIAVLSFPNARHALILPGQYLIARREYMLQLACQSKRPGLLLLFQYLIAWPAINERARAAFASKLLAEDGSFFSQQRVALCRWTQAHPIILLSALRRNQPAQHIPLNQFWLSLQRIAPATATSGDEPNQVAFFQLLIIDQAGQLMFFSSGRIDDCFVSAAGHAASHTIATQNGAVSGANQFGIVEQSHIFFIAQPPPALARAARISCQGELLYQNWKARFAELCRQVFRVGHNMNDIAAISIEAPTRAAAKHFAQQV